MLRCLADLVCLSHTLVICVIHEMIGDEGKGFVLCGVKKNLFNNMGDLIFVNTLEIKSLWVLLLSF